MQEFQFEVTANPKGDKTKISEPVTATITLVDFPETIEEAIELWGADVCYQRLISGVRVTAQGTARGKLEKGLSAEDVDAFFANVNHENSDLPEEPWRPGMPPAASTSKQEKIKGLLDKLSPEQRAALLAEFMGD